MEAKRILLGKQFLFFLVLLLILTGSFSSISRPA